MYAIVSINGHQYKVSSEQSIVVDRLHGHTGDVVQFSPLLVVDNHVVKVGSEAAAYEVVAKIITHGKGDKLDVARFRAKSRYRRQRGFRPQSTTLFVEQIAAKKKVVTQDQPPIKKRRTYVKSKP